MTTTNNALLQFEAEFEGFCEQFNQYLDGTRHLPSNKIFRAELEMYSNVLTQTARLAFNEGLDKAQATRLYLQLDSLMPMFGDNFKNVAPPQLMENLLSISHPEHALEPNNFRKMLPFMPPPPKDFDL